MSDEQTSVWDIPGVGKLVAGIKTELMRVSPNDTVVHVQFPPGTPKDRSAQFAEALRKEFPPRVRMAFTTPGVKLNVMRAKEVNLTIKNCTLSMRDAVDRITQILEEKADVVNISLEGITWRK
jgi:hypothetical protein